MHEVEMGDVTPAFSACWNEAGLHLKKQVQGQIYWLKASLTPPWLEHISFRLGNQLFFVRIEPDNAAARGPGSVEGLRMIAEACRGHACFLPMISNGRKWTAKYPGWGLMSLAGAPVNPINLVSDVNVEMTDWELHDMAVQVVRDHLTKDGYELMSWQGNPNVDPSLWFVGKQGPEWVVVRAVRYPATEAPRPANLAQIAASCRHVSPRGNFASVSVANAGDSFEADRGAMPLWRGHGMFVRYLGLEPISFGRSL